MPSDEVFAASEYEIEDVGLYYGVKKAVIDSASACGAADFPADGGQQSDYPRESCVSPDFESESRRLSFVERIRTVVGQISAYGLAYIVVAH